MLRGWLVQKRLPRCWEFCMLSFSAMMIAAATYNQLQIAKKLNAILIIYLVIFLSSHKDVAVLFFNVVWLSHKNARKDTSAWMKVWSPVQWLSQENACTCTYTWKSKQLHSNLKSCQNTNRWAIKKINNQITHPPKELPSVQFYEGWTCIWKPELFIRL